ncbi:MAG: DUF2927 domain-containing protein [Rhodobacteraceae bacterium]|nr:DUF2927 domain-containing protein [Paracoccaceae bacterium]
MGGRLHLLLGLALLGLMACEQMQVADTGVPPAASTPPARSAESVALEEYYARVQSSLLVQGLLRTDGGGPDTPFNDRQLADNFRQIAFFEEYRTVNGRLEQRATASPLHRWESPVKLQAEFGALVPASIVSKDRGDIAAYADRLARVSGHPVRAVSSGGNFHVLILYEDERRAIEPRLRQLIPGISRTAVDTVVNLPRSSYCLVLALDPDNLGVYTKAVAIIRAEHPDLFRLSCIHEEVAQGLGLANDSPLARPSIFNDDEEFALLTTQDEFMLRMLYDARLRPGMTLTEADPIVTDLARELIGDPPEA